MKRDDVLRILKEHRRELAEQYGVKALALFGSVVRDEAREASDVDLLVEFDERPIGLLHLIGTEQYIEKLLNAHVDLVLRRAILPELKDDILREAIDAF